MESEWVAGVLGIANFGVNNNPIWIYISLCSFFVCVVQLDMVLLHTEEEG